MWELQLGTEEHLPKGEIGANFGPGAKPAAARTGTHRKEGCLLVDGIHPGPWGSVWEEAARHLCPNLAEATQGNANLVPLSLLSFSF